MSLSNQDIKKAMLSQSSDWDKQALWQEINDTLDQPNKKRFAWFWLFGISCVAIGLSAMLTISFTEQKNTKTVKTNQQTPNKKETQTTIKQITTPSKETKLIHSQKQVDKTIPVITNSRTTSTKRENPPKTNVTVNKTQATDYKHPIYKQQKITVNPSSIIHKQSTKTQRPSNTRQTVKSTSSTVSPIEGKKYIDLKENKTAPSIQQDKSTSIPVSDLEIAESGDLIPSKDPFLVSKEADQLIQNTLPSSLTDVSKISKESKRYSVPKWEFIPSFGLNQTIQNYTRINFDEKEIAKPGIKLSTTIGLEISRKLTPDFKARSGILFYTKKYKTQFQQSKSSAASNSYNLSIPLMVEYELSIGKINPYLAGGVGIDYYEPLGGSLYLLNTIKGYGIVQTMYNTGWSVSGLVEIGTHFRLFKQKISLAVLTDLSRERVVDANYYGVIGENLGNVSGTSYSNGNSVSLRLRYHLPIARKKAVYDYLNISK